MYMHSHGDPTKAKQCKLSPVSTAIHLLYPPPPQILALGATLPHPLRPSTSTLDHILAAKCRVGDTVTQCVSTRDVCTCTEGGTMRTGHLL